MSQSYITSAFAFFLHGSTTKSLVILSLVLQVCRWFWMRKRNTKCIHCHGIGITPRPRPLKKGTFYTNAGINSEGSGEISSTQNNLIRTSANSFFKKDKKMHVFIALIRNSIDICELTIKTWKKYQS